MTDMHREGFEKWFDAEHAEHTQQTGGGKGYVQMLKSRAWKVWQAALRYRDEQARCECAYTCKFCRDEQEKQA